MRKIVVALAAGAISVCALVPSAAATPGPTPDEGLTGACNMTNTHAAFGMFDKAVQSGPGLDGMFTAIINSGGDCID